MVVSIIKPEIEYNESKKIDEEDRGYKSRIYEVEILGKLCYVALGKIKYTFTSKDVLYFLVYLMQQNAVKSQIGVVEILSKNMSKLLDRDGVFDLALHAKHGGNILLYKHVNVDFLNMAKSAPPVVKTVAVEEMPMEEKPDIAVPDVLDVAVHNPVSVKAAMGDFVVLEPIPNADVPEMLKEETKADADKLKNPNANTNWVQKFMKNDNFRIHAVPADGDCFFSVIRDAFKQIGLKTTIEKLRKVVADGVNQPMLEQYQTMYGMFANSIAENDAKIKRIKESIQELKSRYNKAADKADKKQLLELIEERQKDAKMFAKQNVITEDNMEHFIFMKDVKTIADLQNAIMRSSYWADEVALSKIEDKLNIKLIVLSKENYDNGSEDTVMVCNTGTTVNPSPEYYIMTSYNGVHYDLISYKDKKILKYSEIPYYIKTLLLINVWNIMQARFTILLISATFRPNLELTQCKTRMNQKHVMSELFDDSVQFMFYGASADAKPGKGSGEKIGAKDIILFNNLQLVANWRRKLDDTYAEPFTYDNKRWQTVEHYYQASKFKKGFPDFYAQFSLDSESEISKNVKMAMGAGGKTGRFEKELVRPKDVKLDADFYGGRDRVERGNALMAKFEQNPELRKMLLDTRDAKLLHFVRGSEPEVDTLLMETRKKLKV